MGLAERFTGQKLQQNYFDQTFFRNGTVAVIDAWLKTDCAAPIAEVVGVIEAHHHCLEK